MYNQLVETCEEHSDIFRLYPPEFLPEKLPNSICSRIRLIKQWWAFVGSTQPQTDFIICHQDDDFLDLHVERLRDQVQEP